MQLTMYDIITIILLNTSALKKMLLKCLIVEVSHSLANESLS